MPPLPPSCFSALSRRGRSADVSGEPTVIDGDTIVVAGERVRLQGIDAPELHQTCTAYGQEWACGRTSAEWLSDYLRERQADCVGHARDRYDRLLAVCYGGESINGSARPRRVGARFPQVLVRLPAGRVGGQAHRRRHLARRVHPALGVARSTPLTSQITLP
jgi:hypothetical protein